MAWIASVVNCVKNSDGETVDVTGQLSNGIKTKQLGPWKLSASDPDTLKLSIIKILRDAERFESRRDDTAATAASFDAATVIGKTSAAIQADYELAHPEVKTQDQLDAAAFYEATQLVINISNILVAASSSKVATKLTQKDLDDARIAWKNALSANPDKFLSLIPKDFPY